MNVFEEVKSRVSLYDAAAFYSAAEVKGGENALPLSPGGKRRPVPFQRMEGFTIALAAERVGT